MKNQQQHSSVERHPEREPSHHHIWRNDSKSQPVVFCYLLKTNSKECLFSLNAGSKTAASGISAPSSRPPWVTDPNFADRYRPDKTSTVVTQHQQPVQPTPMENRSSILQAAQQTPQGSERTPVCGACNKIIRWESVLRGFESLTHQITDKN